MKKLWKRLVMLGALVGCMATAAWAGNVEVNLDPLGGEVSIHGLADGFYVTSEKNPGVSYAEYEYHFDKMEELHGRNKKVRKLLCQGLNG